jgi:cell division protein FtsQ
VGVGRGRNRRRVDRTPEEIARGRARAFQWTLGLVLTASALAGGAAGVRWLSSSGAFRIRDIRFEGLSRASADELVAYSPVKVGDSFFFADLDAMERGLLRHPWVRRVEIRHALPPSLVVRVEERRPIALVELSGLYLVDDEGTIFKRAAAGDPLDLPLVTGISRAEYQQSRRASEELLAHALALVQAWRDGGRPRPTLSEIHIEPDGVTLHVGEEGTEVRLGAGDLGAKLSRLDKVLSALHAEGKRAEVVHLDNRLHPSWVTVRLATAAVGSLRAQGQPEEAGLERAGGMGGRVSATPHH